MKKIITTLIGMVLLITFVLAYTPPSHNDIDLVLESDYSPPNHTSINLVLGEPSDSCSYSSGDWEINCSDNCNISSDIVLDGNDLVFSDSGSFTIEANKKITNFTNMELSNGCNIILNDGSQLITT